MSIAVLIPALKPARSLLEVMDVLGASDAVESLIIVNDGSPAEFDAIFLEAASRPKTVVLRHAVNLGKGAALRTGMNHFLCNASPGSVLVSADADGQHLPADILAVGAQAEKNNRELVMGARAFSGEVPLRSRFGNDLTRWIFRALIGIKVTDTQTGLRAIPRALMPVLLRLKTKGYEFELEMLICAARARIPITAVPIQTVYLDGNQSSHFNPLLDSMRIYFIFARFLSSSFISSVLDYIVFAIVLSTTQSLLWSIASARIVSGTMNFMVNKNLVFQSRSEWWRLLVKYAAMEIVLGTVSLLFIRALWHRGGWSPYIAKPLVEIVLFIGSYAVQRNLIFDMTPEDDDEALAH